MVTGDAPRRRENAFTLVKRLVSGGIGLAKLEVRHAREEMARNLGELKGGVLLLALAAALAFVFLIAFVAFVIAVLVVIGLWWLALIVLVLILVVAGLLARAGIGRLKRVKPTPEETIASVKEELEWAKSRLLKRG